MRTVKLAAFTGEIGNIGKEEQVPQRQEVEGQRCPLRASTGSLSRVCNYLGCSPEICLSCSAIKLIHSLSLSMLYLLAVQRVSSLCALWSRKSALC